MRFYNRGEKRKTQDIFKDRISHMFTLNTSKYYFVIFSILIFSATLKYFDVTYTTDTKHIYIYI